MYTCKRCRDTGGVIGYGGFCDCELGKLKRAEIEGEVTDADKAEALRLFDEGWSQRSRKYRVIHRYPEHVRLFRELPFSEMVDFYRVTCPDLWAYHEAAFRRTLVQSLVDKTGGMQESETTPSVLTVLRDLHRQALAAVVEAELALARRQAEGAAALH